MTWFISDTHFNHENIIKYCNRPFSSVEEMNEYMIKEWNAVVKEKDIICHLGDFALGSKNEIESLVKRLNGNKILILGNHDKRGREWFLNRGFVKVYKRLILDNYIFSHVPQPLKILANGKINIHGHTHGENSYLDKNKYMNVSVEVTEYKPIWIDLPEIELQLTQRIKSYTKD